MGRGRTLLEPPGGNSVISRGKQPGLARDCDMLTMMFRKTLAVAAIAAGLFTAGYMTANAANSHRVYELRTYTSLDGRHDALMSRFRDHTIQLFEKHGMANVGYWVPQDDPMKKNTLIYVLSHASRDAAKKSWDAFRADPVWVKARDASEKDGKIVAKVESVFMDPADFSALK